jgi:hypothetical protein
MIPFPFYFQLRRPLFPPAMIQAITTVMMLAIASIAIFGVRVGGLVGFLFSRFTESFKGRQV